jgi:hypothetical protein
MRNESYSQILIKHVSILFKSMYYSNYKTYDKASMNSKTPSLPTNHKTCNVIPWKKLKQVQKGKQRKNLEKGKGKEVGLFDLLSRVLNLPHPSLVFFHGGE